MSIKLSKNEKILKEYAYSTVTVNNAETSKKLIITNKRLVHRIEMHKMGGEEIVNEQINVGDIKSVDASYGKQAHPIFIFWAVIFGLAAVAMLAAKILVGAVIGLLAAAGCVALYIFKKEYVVTCSFGFENATAELVAGSGMAGYGAGGKAVKKIKIAVNGGVAKDMVEEIGALILDANECSAEIASV